MTGEKLQHQITEAIQDHLMAQLDREISWLPPLRRRVLNGLQLEVPDERVRAWRSVDRFSSAWVDTTPTAMRRLDDMEMQYVASMYFGVDVPALEAVAGKVGSARYSVGVIDPQGSVLTCNSRMTTIHRTHAHDSSYQQVTRSSEAVGVRTLEEPANVFTAAVHYAARATWLAHHA